MSCSEDTDGERFSSIDSISMTKQSDQDTITQTGLHSPMKEIPPAPPDWNLTISDLMAETKAGKRKPVGSPELDWARNYERSLLPTDTRFPKKGDVYEAIEDVPVHFMTAWAAPFTGSGDGVLKKGEQVFLKDEPPNPRPIRIYASAVDYDLLEARMVPGGERQNDKYRGFYFSIKTRDMIKSFRLVRTGCSRD